MPRARTNNKAEWKRIDGKGYSVRNGNHRSKKNDKNEVIGNITFKNGLLRGSELIFDYKLEVIKGKNYSESDVDSKSVSLLRELGWKEQDEIRQQKTNISEIDDYLKSKKDKSQRKGHADIYLLINNKLKIIIENKNPNESVDGGIEDAIFYANCLLKKGYDIRIVMSFNGNKCLLRVFDSKSEKWIPFLINGVEVNAFPSKELVEIIYRYRDISGIIITEDSHTINVSHIINGLREIYRNISHIQNDNQKAMDFTIAFIALKSILEKHGDELEKNWEDLKIAEQKKLKEKIKTYVEDIVNNLENGYKEIFSIEKDAKGKIEEFDFLKEIAQFPNKVGKGEVGYLVKIFNKINELPHLHASKFDPFAEVYQSLMDKSTRKIFGQFFTPRHLIKPLIRLFFEEETQVITGEVKNGKAVNPRTLCDPACGTGGFLTEYFKFFVSKLNDIDVISFAKKSIHGFDIYPANAVRSRINMYLAGDGFSRIEALDSLRSFHGKQAIQFDYILTNPPFGKGDYAVDPNIITNRRKEVNFLTKVIMLLKPHAKALIIVPDGILEAPTLAPLRKWLLQNCAIEKIIGLPKFEFAPYTHEKTYVLFLKKRSNEINKLDEINTERIWMYIVDNDGYANSDKKFRTGRTDNNGKWLHDEVSLWRDKKGAFHPSVIEENWKKKVQPRREKYRDEWGREIEGLKYGFVELRKILEKEYAKYNSVKKDSVKKLVQEITNSNNLSVDDLFEEKEEADSDLEETMRILKPEYGKILEKQGISYDPFEDKFIDEGHPVRENLLNLVPEEYLRPRKVESLKLDKFIQANTKLISELKNDLLRVGKKLKDLT